MSRVRPVLRRLRPHPLAFALAVGIAGVGAQPASPHLRPHRDFGVTVENCNDSGTGSLRDVVANALDGDRIAIPPDLGCSAIALTSGPIVVGNDDAGHPFTALEISGPGHALFTIDGGSLDRVFVQDAGVDAVLTLEGLTLSNGKSLASGGCIFAHGSLALDDVEVTTCVVGVLSGDTTLGTTALRGGGIYAGNTVTLSGSTVSANRIYAYGSTAYVYGGGVFAVHSVDAVSSTITGNLAFSTGGAAYGGGLAAGDKGAFVQSTVTLTASTVTNNTSYSRCSFCGSRGGGIWTYGNTALTGGEVHNNTALSTYGYGTGGGLYFHARFEAPPVTATANGTDFICNYADTGGGIAAGGDLVVSRALLSCNLASTKDGGAIELFGGNLTLSDSTIVSNAAAYSGAGVFVFGYGDATIVNSTITGNTAAYGGGIGNTYGSLHIANTTIADNRGLAHGGGIYFRYSYYVVDLQSTIVAGNDDGAGTPDDIWPPGMNVTGDHNLVVAADGVTLPGDTLSDDPLLLPLDLNGGATSTMALSEGSPAIDAGSNPLSLANDQRGEGFARVVGSDADIGAFEVQPKGPTDEIFTDGFEP